MNDVTYSEDIQKMILANLDGWQVVEPEPEVTDSSDVELSDNDSSDTDSSNSDSSDTTSSSTTSSNTDITPFMTVTETYNKVNKIITAAECKLFYEETLDMAYMYTNRLNVDDLTQVELRVFLRGVCKWTASNLWNKYNIRVNNEDMEDTYIQSYGGLLYKSALNTLQPFINQRITSVSSIRANNNDDDSDFLII